jgi:hypothetical protein
MHMVPLEDERSQLTATVEEASAVAADAQQLLHAKGEELNGAKGSAQMLVQLVAEVGVHSDPISAVLCDRVAQFDSEFGIRIRNSIRWVNSSGDFFACGRGSWWQR